MDEINVTYKFRNHSAKEITTKVAFPLPPSPYRLYDTTNVFPQWDESAYIYSSLEEFQEKEKIEPTLLNRIKNNAFLNFKCTVNGKEIAYTTQHEAINKDGKNIIDTLQDQKIPISSVYLGGFMDVPALDKNPDLKKKLSDLGFLNESGLPTWQLKTTFYWDQVYPALKDLSIKHTYHPHPGYYWLQGKKGVMCINELEFIHRNYGPDGKPELKKMSDYIISPQEQQKIIKLFDGKVRSKKIGYAYDDKILFRVYEIDYILTTGNNWKGPIKSFRLEIKPPSKECIILTNIDGKLIKSKKGIYVFETTNYRPSQDLKILFIDPKHE